MARVQGKRIAECVALCIRIKLMKRETTYYGSVEYTLYYHCDASQKKSKKYLEVNRFRPNFASKNQILLSYEKNKIIHRIPAFYADVSVDVLDSRLYLVCGSMDRVHLLFCPHVLTATEICKAKYLWLAYRDCGNPWTHPA